ncbi:hypothetical protein C8J56DRAFT_848863 [Mycena floridula]|nr:hypothetical protein C8J56DRAFT_866845 [Mycena floridula]KAJ7598912.1 hypothetical protein C8J56DRAFT_848863 [Mycena floridula]
METPPTTPQRQRDAERQNERNSRVLNTPQHRRLPNQVSDIPPAPRLNRGDDPFLDVDLNGEPLRLTQGLAAAVQALPPLVLRSRAAAVCISVP